VQRYGAKLHQKRDAMELAAQLGLSFSNEPLSAEAVDAPDAHTGCQSPSPADRGYPHDSADYRTYYCRESTGVTVRQPHLQLNSRSALSHRNYHNREPGWHLCSMPTRLAAPGRESPQLTHSSRPGLVGGPPACTRGSPRLAAHHRSKSAPQNRAPLARRAPSSFWHGLRCFQSDSPRLETVN
jgi:hypothetical protein